MVKVNDPEINELKRKIDMLDRRLLDVLEKRFEMVKDIAVLKKRKGFIMSRFSDKTPHFSVELES
ncbi:MAG TPA: chorismate mutase [Candidatus Nanoarchaeia archaeon]|nr:chorismate mutase [Candidatus Nanoarchaeia archaeon]